MPPLFALGGVCLNELFNRWKRREHLKSVLFNKKIDFYQGLVGRTADILMDLIMHGEDKPLPDKFAQIPAEIYRVLNANLLFATPEVRKLASEFADVINKKEMTLLEKTRRLGRVHRALQKQCQKELGLKALEKDLQGNEKPETQHDAEASNHP